MQSSSYSAQTSSGVSFQFSLMPSSVEFDAENDNVDVELVVGGQRYHPTVFTLANVAALMSRHEKTGECADGKYFWAADMIIVRRLSVDSLTATFADLIESGDLKWIVSVDESAVE